jgi:hypothetical protein
MSTPAAVQLAGTWRRYVELLLAEADQPDQRISLRRQRKTVIWQIAAMLERWPTVEDLARVPGAERITTRLAMVIAADLRRLKGARTRAPGARRRWA